MDDNEKDALRAIAELEIERLKGNDPLAALEAQTLDSDVWPPTACGACGATALRPIELSTADLGAEDDPRTVSFRRKWKWGSKVRGYACTDCQRITWQRGET